MLSQDHVESDLSTEETVRLFIAIRPRSKTLKQQHISWSKHHRIERHRNACPEILVLRFGQSSDSLARSRCDIVLWIVSCLIPSLGKLAN